MGRRQRRRERARGDRVGPNDPKPEREPAEIVIAFPDVPAFRVADLNVATAEVWRPGRRTVVGDFD